MANIQPFEPLPWQIEPWRDTNPILLLTGAAGGGKSFLAANKIHGFCLAYPGSTALILRKERAVMSNSTLLMMERMVIGDDPRVVHKRGSFRFEYENGSVLAYGGMKDDAQRERIRSIGLDGGLDICWMEEATQFIEQDFNEVIARMRGKAAPWRQIILSTNPGPPGHWINVRLILGGEASVYYSRATDNEHNPDDYHDILKRLSGVQRKRLLDGEWVAGAGKIIDTWSDVYNDKTGKSFGGNVTLDAEYQPGNGYVVWAVDDGYSGKMDEKTGIFADKSHPRAIMMCQIRSDGRITVFGETLAVNILANDHFQLAKNMSKANGWEKPLYVVRDRAAASLDGVSKGFGLRARYNQMSVDESLKELRTVVAPDENGVRRLIVHPRCFYTRYQMQTYSYNEQFNVIKDHDDTIDALRYLVFEVLYGKSPVVDVATIDDSFTLEVESVW